MALNSAENRQSLISVFPRLSVDPVFEVESPETSEYNCIAWAMGFDDRWVDHLPDYSIARKKWWPEGVDRDYRPETLVAAFEKMGFEVCDDDTTEQDYDKVALYKISPLIDPFTNQKIADEGWTHAARVLSSGIYHSKIGAMYDIHHRGGDVFEGTSYGQIYCFMKRKVSDRSLTDKVKAEQPVISVPSDIYDIIAKMMA